MKRVLQRRWSKWIPKQKGKEMTVAQCEYGLSHPKVRKMKRLNKFYFALSSKTRTALKV